jgi:ankyrin repeat protein
MTENLRDVFGAVDAGDVEAVRRQVQANPAVRYAPHPQLRQDQTHGGVHQDDWTLLHTAARLGNLEMVRELVDLGVEVYSNPLASYPAVAVAAWANQDPVVDYFLREIPDRAQGTRDLGATIHIAGRLGWMDLVEAHVRRDPLAVHQRGWIGDSPLHWPAHNGFRAIVQFLLANGADPNAPEIDCYGGTPLHWAAERHVDICADLLNAGADVNAQVSLSKSGLLGATPLNWCARQPEDSGDVAKLLRERGADLTLVDAEGFTARDRAEANGNRRILAALA